MHFFFTCSRFYAVWLQASSSSTDSIEVGGSTPAGDQHFRLPSAAELREQIRMLEDYIGEISFILVELHKRFREEQAKQPHSTLFTFSIVHFGTYSNVFLQVWQRYPFP
jgi:hypothetical protein